MVEPHQGGGGVTAVVGQCGDQPVGISDAGAVGASHHDFGLDDPHGQPVQARQVRTVGQMLADLRAARGRARPSSIAPVRVMSAKNQPASKPRSSRTSMPGRSSGSSRVARAVSSRSAAERRWRPAGRGCRSRPAPSAAASGTRPSSSGSGSGRSRSGCGQCRGSSPSCSRRRRRCAARRSGPRACTAAPAARPPPQTAPSAAPGPGGGAGPAAPSPTGTPGPARPGPRSACPTPVIAKMREHAQRQDEIHSGPGRQIPQPPLHRLGLRQDVIDQLERQVLG